VEGLPTEPWRCADADAVAVEIWLALPRTMQLAAIVANRSQLIFDEAALPPNT